MNENKYESEHRCSFCGWTDGEHSSGCPYFDYDPKNPLTKPLPDWFFETIKKIIQREDDDIHKTEHRGK